MTPRPSLALCQSWTAGPRPKLGTFRSYLDRTPPGRLSSEDFQVSLSTACPLPLVYLGGLVVFPGDLLCVPFPCLLSLL